MGLDIILFGSKLGQLDEKFPDGVRSDFRCLSRLVMKLIAPNTPEAERLRQKYNLGHLTDMVSHEEEQERPVAEHPDCWAPTADVLAIYERLLDAVRRPDPDVIAVIEQIRQGESGHRGWPIQYEYLLEDCEDTVALCRKALESGEEYATLVISW